MQPSEHPTIHHTELKPLPAGEVLAAEWEVYRREVGRWLAEGLEGRWVLIKYEGVIGFFDRREAAMDEARKRYLMPRRPFLVDQIQTSERVLRVNRLLRPGPCPTSPCQ
jgi:hypothetical protein